MSNGTTSWNHVVQHVIDNLPAEFEKRHKLVSALADVIPNDHPMHDPIAELRFGLDHHATALIDIPNLTSGKKGGANERP